jgi:hypothetical protein
MYRESKGFHPSIKVKPAVPDAKTTATRIKGKINFFDKSVCTILH